MGRPDDDELNDAMAEWLSEPSVSDEGASAEAHDKLQKRVADDEQKRKGK